MTSTEATRMCPCCSAVVSASVIVCAPCRLTLMGEVRAVNDTLRELDTTLSRQDKVTPASVGGKSPVTPLPYSVGASYAIVELRSATRALARDGVTAATIARFRQARSAAWRAVDIPDPLIFVGVCDCDRALYARMDDQTVLCQCGAEWDAVAADTSGLLERMGPHVGTAAEVAGLMRMYGFDLPTDRLQWWARAGYVEPVGKGRRGWPTYRIADVVVAYGERMKARVSA